MTYDTLGELNDFELSEVTGGMSCDAAHTLATVYFACALGALTAHNVTLGEGLLNTGIGVIQGGCLK